MSLLSRAEESNFTRLVNGDLKVENAVIFKTNFEGRPTDFVPKGGKRTFLLVLTKDMADVLSEEGWNVKYRSPKVEGDDPLMFTEIIVNMESNWPPKVCLYSGFNGRKSANNLNEETITCLDKINIASVDLIIHPRRRKPDGSSPYTVKGYANDIRVVQAPDSNFGDKYAEYYGE